jgi:nucleoside-diphosphate-sugar epimerase
MTTLIVGCGYLGTRVCHQLRTRGEHVYGTTRRSDGRPSTLAAVGIDPVVADVLDRDSLRRLPKVDRVFYCVGFDRAAGASMRSVYVDGLRNLLEALPTTVNRLVYASSTGVYGQTDGSWVDEDSPTEPEHESGKVCLEAESFIMRWSGGRGGETSSVILRYAGLYGPGRVIRSSTLLRGEPISGDRAKFLNLIEIDDAATAGVLALCTPQPGRRLYTVADDRPVPRSEYYSLMAEILNAPAPRFEAIEPDGPLSGRDATNKRISNQRIKADLGLRLTYPDVSVGLRHALEGMRRTDQPSAGST